MSSFKHASKTLLPLWLMVFVALAIGSSGANAHVFASGSQHPNADVAQGSEFTFHGQLAKGGTLITASCDFTFSLWDASSGDTQLGTNQAIPGVSVTNGVFAVALNGAGQFGPNAFNGSARWLGIQVQCPGDAAVSDLGRQSLLATPYALSVTSSAGNSIVGAINDPATTGKINTSRLSSDVIQLAPATPQISVGDANGTAPMLNLRGGSTCCGGPDGYTPADFKVYQNGSFVATGNLGIGVSPMQGKGYRTSWDSYKGAFRSGYADTEWDDANVGFFSWSGGSNSTASGLYSLAFGDTNQAVSTSSIAFGSGNEVKGAAGFSAGAGNRVCDTYGVALGNKAQSGGPLVNGKCDPTTVNINGLAAVAIGYNVTADKDHTLALGKFASNNGFAGTFIWSDGSATASANTFKNTANNEFAARATGGFRFRTNVAGTTGCNLPAGSGVFDCTSDRNQKEHFSSIDGEAVLHGIANMSIQSWNYKEDPAKTRHVGPTAQDFFGAFGLGSGDKTIGMLDIDGVNMLAIQTLEKRTQDVQRLGTRVTQLEAEKAQTQQQLNALEARLSALEQAQGGNTVSTASNAWIWAFGGAFVVLAVFGMWRIRHAMVRKGAV